MANPHPEPHPENLRPHKKGDPATVEKARKGGHASQKKQARNRSMREWAEFYANLPLHRDGKVKDPKAAEEIRDTNTTMEGAVLAAMYNKAIKGDVRAAEFLAKLKGQTTEDVTVHIDTMQSMSTDELLALYEKTKGAKE
jgi:hypothetical protein